MIIRALVVVAILGSSTFVLADSRTEAQLHVDHATTLHGEGKFAEASAELAVAYALDTRPELLYALGQLQVALGNCSQATAFYRRFLTTRPDEGPAGAATEAIETCAKSQPGTPPTNAKLEAKRRIDLATSLHGRGDFQQARSELVVAYALDPDPKLLFAIGQLDVKLDQCADAILFYERFTLANPDLAGSAGATDAIATCKTKLAAPVAPVAPVAPPPPPPAPPRWYADPIGLGLLAGGLALGVVGGLRYGAALSDLDAADTATTYDRQAALVDSAHSKRTYAAVFGIGAVALTGAAVVRFVMHRPATRESRGVAIVPASGGGGGVVTWSGSF
jgi:tetratricopeptide (TPR) repeat protein